MRQTRPTTWIPTRPWRRKVAGGIVALDINSTRTGVAFGDRDSLSPHFVSWRLPGTDDLSRACGALYDLLIVNCKVLKPRIIAIEAPIGVVDRFHSARSAEVLTALYGAALAGASNAGSTAIKGNIGEIRRHFIGHANLRADEAARRIADQCRILKWAASNHDEADAAALWSWAMATRTKGWLPNGEIIYGKVRGVLS